MQDSFGKGVIALVRGQLRGMHREATCELLARKRPLPGAGQFGMRRYEYTQFSIVQAPADFPDGKYTVTTEDGQELPVTKLHGLWMIEKTERSSGETPGECA